MWKTPELVLYVFKTGFLDLISMKETGGERNINACYRIFSSRACYGACVRSLLDMLAYLFFIFFLGFRQAKVKEFIKTSQCRDKQHVRKECVTYFN